MSTCLCRMALNMNKETKEQIEKLSSEYIESVLTVVQKAIDKKVDELDAEYDSADRTADRRDEIRDTVRDMINDGDIVVSIEA